MVSEPTHPMTQLSFIIDAPNLRPNHHHMGFISQEMDFSQWYKIQFIFPPWFDFLDSSLQCFHHQNNFIDNTNWLVLNILEIYRNDFNRHFLVESEFKYWQGNKLKNLSRCQFLNKCNFITLYPTKINWKIVPTDTVIWRQKRVILIVFVLKFWR